jgi:hypothetical protein
MSFRSHKYDVVASDYSDYKNAERDILESQQFEQKVLLDMHKFRNKQYKRMKRKFVNATYKKITSGYLKKYQQRQPSEQNAHIVLQIAAETATKIAEDMAEKYSFIESVNKLYLIDRKIPLRLSHVVLEQLDSEL